LKDSTMSLWNGSPAEFEGFEFVRSGDVFVGFRSHQIIVRGERALSRLLEVVQLGHAERIDTDESGNSLIALDPRVNVVGLMTRLRAEGLFAEPNYALFPQSIFGMGAPIGGRFMLPGPANPGPTFPNPVYPGAILPDPVYPNPVYPNPVYPNPVYPNAAASCCNPCCAGRGLAGNPVYPNPVYPNPVYPNPVYPNPVYPNPVYPNPVYPNPVYPNPVYPNPVYPNAFHPCSPCFTPCDWCGGGASGNPVYPNPVYPNPVYANPVYPNPVYPNPVYPNPVYPNPVYPNPVYCNPCRCMAPAPCPPPVPMCFVCQPPRGCGCGCGCGGRHEADQDKKTSSQHDSTTTGPLRSGAVPVPGPGSTPWSASSKRTAPTIMVLDSGLAKSAYLPDLLRSLDGSTADPDRDEPDESGDSYVDPFAGHGTFIAGIVEQRIPGRQLAVGRTLSTFLPTDEWTIATRIGELLAHGLGGYPVDARTLVNLSFGGYGFDVMLALHDRILALQKAGAVVVASAGNDHSSAAFYPACLPGVVGVGALDQNGAPANFSNSGAWVRACAVGVDVRSCYFDNYNGPLPPSGNTDPDNYQGWAKWSGTSFAAPQVVGALAKVMADTGCSAAQAVALLIDDPSLRRIPGLGTVVS
jgi:hypothetical protein